jgi:hypothetical protein
MFERAGIDISGISEAVTATAPVLHAARAIGIPVVYLKIIGSANALESAA